MFKSRGGARDTYEFLPAALEVLDTPPRPAARMVTWLIILFLAIALTWSILGRIDQVAIASGQIVPTTRVQLIQPIENGVVRAIHVRDGQVVKAGEPLVDLDPTEASASVETARADLTKARLDAAIAAALLEADPAVAFVAPEEATGAVLAAARAQLLGEVEKLRASVAMIDADIAEQQAARTGIDSQLQKASQSSEFIAKRLEALEILHETGLARMPDLMALRQQWLENQSEISSVTATIEQIEPRLDSRIKRREEVISTARADAYQRQADALRRVATLEQQLRRDRQREADRRLRAPAAGTILGLSVFTVGGVVTTKDVLMRLVPDGAKLEAEVVVLNKDIGFVKEGQRVDIKLETFPFTRYGLIPGVVKQVWRDAVQDDKQGLVYKAEITMQADRILVGDTWVRLAPGMSVQAEIKTGDRRVIDYFLSPLLRYQDESLRER